MDSILNTKDIVMDISQENGKEDNAYTGNARIIDMMTMDIIMNSGRIIEIWTRDVALECQDNAMMRTDTIVTDSATITPMMTLVIIIARIPNWVRKNPEILKFGWQSAKVLSMCPTWFC